MKIETQNIQLIVIDFLCGAGGVTSGFEEATINGEKVAKVIAGLNHDEVAIDSHGSNFLHVKHYVKDLRDLDEVEILKLIAHWKSIYPYAKVVLWFSLECTNFSKAKGGMPRDADSRTLADELVYRKDHKGKRTLPGYVPALNPDYVMIENVEEFMCWGPLDDQGKPISKKNGKDYIKWCNAIQSFGYRFEHNIINSANLGAYTSRKRYFGIFAKHGLPIAWPVSTHSKNPEKEGMFGKLEKWKAVKEVLDLDDHGKTIFGRKKDLSEKTLARIYAGLVKYIAGGKENFLAKTYAVASNSHGCNDTDRPATTLTTRDAHQLVTPEFIVQRNSGEPSSKVASIQNPARTLTATGGNLNLVQTEFFVNYHHSSSHEDLNKPCPTLTCKDKLAILKPQFLDIYYGRSEAQDINRPCRTLRTRAGQSLITAQFLDKQYSGDANHQSIEQPAGTIMQNDKHALVSAEQFIEVKHSQGKQDSSIENPMGSLTTVTKENLITAEKFIMDTQFNNTGSSIENPLPTITANRKYHYIINPSWSGNNGSIENPACVVVARQDKSPLYLVTTEEGFLAIEIFETDSEYTKKIKEFMALYGIIDIKMRMLKVNELLKIQGFPEGYILKGTQADQKKFIGNAVVPLVAQKMAEAIATKLIEMNEGEVAA